MRTGPVQKKIVILLLTALGTAWAVMPALAQQKLTPLRQIINVEVNSLPFIVAYEEGIYKKNGLDVDQCISRGGVLQRQGSGFKIPPEHVCAPPKGGGPIINEENAETRSADAGPFSISGGGPRVVRQMKAGRLAETVILANFDPVTNWTILTRKDITLPSQLKGKRIGVTGYSNINGYMALLFVQAMGWDPHSSDITIVTGQRELENLRNGDVDAAVVVAMVAITGVDEGFNRLVDLREWKIPMIGNALNVDRDWLKKNPETARQYVKSMVEAIALMKNDKQVAYRAMAKWYGWTDPQKQAKLYQYATEIPSKPYPTSDAIERYLKVYFPNQPWPFEPRAFYDDSLLRELDKSGFIDGLYKK